MIDRLFDFSPVPTIAHSASHIDQRYEYERLATLRFHIETDDYFRFLATLLSFFEETLASGDGTQKESLAIELEAVRAARKDLQYLNDHYRIEPRQ